MYITSIVALMFVCCISSSEALTQPFSNRVIISGPSACAVDNAYKQWVSGPLGGQAPAASAFSATVDATANPIKVTFSPTSGSTPVQKTYSVASATCVDSSWPALASGFQYPVGSATLSGSYVLALVAADVVHAQAQPASFTPSSSFAYTSSLGSGVVIVTTSNGNFNVGYNQYYDSGTIIIGCYKEQRYLVDATTFAVLPTTSGCPR